MFGFLKKKLSEAIDKFTKKAEEEAEVVEEPVEQKKEPEVPQYKPEKEKEKQEVPKKEKKKEEPAKKPVKGKKVTKKEEEVLKEPIKDVSDEKQEKTKDESEEVEEEAEELAEDIEENLVEEEKEPAEEEPEKPDKEPEKKGFFAKIFGKKEEPKKEVSAVEKPKEEPVVEEEPVEETEEPVKEAEPEEKKGFLGKISDTFTKVSLSETKFEELFWDLEVSLLENNVAVEVIEKIKQDLVQDLVEKKIARNSLDTKVIESLRNSISGLFDVEQIDLIKEAKSKKPYVMVMIGINGTGKTTTLAKLIHFFKKNKLDTVVAASDTFRAAAIHQLEEHTNKLGVKLIKHDYDADPAAVAYDAVEHAKAKDKDIVMIDTAGRLHSNKNLMQELEKVIRVVKPDLKIFVGESIAGNDMVEQVKLFNESVGIDAIVLSKADIDEKGGAAISVSYITGKPILFLGTGQGYDDLVKFDKKKLLEQIGLG
ncbi:signal recognition particle-docking protein FtsY [Candidatus Woesearchaeota archaeon]|nr:signal recognition particle-docking protein FtsY [Candidatus Woesearchaeota archaeon]